MVYLCILFIKWLWLLFVLIVYEENADKKCNMAAFFCYIFFAPPPAFNLEEKQESQVLYLVLILTSFENKIQLVEPIHKYKYLFGFIYFFSL